MKASKEVVVSWFCCLFQIGLSHHNFTIKKLIFNTLISLKEEKLNVFLQDDEWLFHFIDSLDVHQSDILSNQCDVHDCEDQVTSQEQLHQFFAWFLKR